MANFYVTNSRYPSNPQLFTVNLTKTAKLGGEANINFNPTFKSAEEYWTLVVYTTGKDAAGNAVPASISDIVGSLTTIDSLVSSQIDALAAQIDWSNQGSLIAQVDESAPIIVSQSPSPQQQEVGITESIVIKVQDLLPGDGIDISTVSMKVNGIPVNPTITGNKFLSTFTFKPRPVLDS